MQNINSTTYGLTVPHPHGDLEIEVGDAKQDKFHPRMKIKKWDNEVNFSVGVIDDEPEKGQIEQNGDIIKWKKGTVEAHFYPREDLYADDDKRGHEFEILLKEKPQINIIELSIQTKGLNFFYQLPLTSKEKLLGENRPENVEGSYAVYHKIQSGDQRALGGKHYAAGKAFHIYRPIAHDANGKQVYCDIKINEDSQILSIVIPQDFLNSALYPIIVDPTFGYTTIGGTNISVTNTNQYYGLSPVSAPAGTIININSYQNNNNSGATQKGIISDSSGNLLINGISNTYNVPFGGAAWEQGTWTAPNQPVMSNGVSYMVLRIASGSGGAPGEYLDTSTGAGEHVIGQSFTTPANFTPASDNSIRSIYVTYTAPLVAIPTYTGGDKPQPIINTNIRTF